MFDSGEERGERWEAVFDSENFERDPENFYRRAGPLIYHDKKPSLVHTVLAELERRGALKAVITQNIDQLHQRAGSARVIELHGSPRMHYCPRCAGIRVPYGEAAAAVGAGRVPRCPRCAAVLKPAITFYGDPLPFAARREAEEEASAADLMLVLGTSLTVNPAAAIPRTCLRHGGKIVIINRQDTPLDQAAFLRFRDLPAVAAALRVMFRIPSAAQ